MTEPGDRTIELFERITRTETTVQHMAEAIDRVFSSQETLREELIEAINLMREEVSSDLSAIRKGVSKNKATIIRSGGFIAGVSATVVVVWTIVQSLIGKLGIWKLWQ